MHKVRLVEGVRSYLWRGRTFTAGAEYSFTNRDEIRALEANSYFVVKAIPDERVKVVLPKTEPLQAEPKKTEEISIDEPKKEVAISIPQVQDKAAQKPKNLKKR